MEHLALTLTTDINVDDERKTEGERVVDTLFAYIRDAWSKMLEEKSGEIEQGDYRELYNRFETEVGHYLFTCWAYDRPYPSNLESGLANVAVTAAKNGEQWAVSRLTRMIIELWVVAGRQDNLRVNGLARVIASGGQEGVEDAFEHILSYDHVDEDDLGGPVSIGEDSWEEKMNQRNSNLYDNVIEHVPRLNSIPDFKEQVSELRKQVNDRYEGYFAESS